MDSEILFRDEQGLLKAGDNIVIVTFASQYANREDQLFTVFAFYGRVREVLPNTTGYQLEFLHKQRDNSGLPGYELRISMTDPEAIKRIAVELEFDSHGRRVFDIDIIIPYEG